MFQPSAVVLSVASAFFVLKHACVASTAHLLAALWNLICVCRQKDKERKSRLSLFLTKSGSHENVSPHKKKTAPANK